MDVFPVNLATGRAFCNRESERKLLKQYIRHGRHVVIVAPRRYGKTSLIHQTLQDIKLPHAIMELTMASTVAHVEHIVVNQIGQLIQELLPRSSQVKQKILGLFAWLNPELVLSVAGQKLVFHPQRSDVSTLDSIAQMLKRLDDAAGLVKKRVVVVMDEFQQISDIEGQTVEATIRHAMQYSKHVSYVFSGSRRHMLLSMFNDKSRPFFNSCEMMQLGRIAANDYVPFIQRAAKSRWKKHLSDEVLRELFRITERHPSYINRICGHFWLIKKAPSVTTIHHYWRDYIASRHAEFTEEVLRLSSNQRHLLVHIAKSPTTMPSSQVVAQSLKMAEASLRQALRKLMLTDLVYRDEENTIRVLDPAFRDFLLGL